VDAKHLRRRQARQTKSEQRRAGDLAGFDGSAP